MEFVVQEAAKKVLDGELLRARQLRQKQVRQQASQWSEERTRRFEQEKLRQKMEMAQQVTEQVQQYAKERIEHLLTAHDLAVAEVGTAHRAAAKLRDAELQRKQRAEDLKVVAQLRGEAASRAMLDTQKKKMEMRNETARRKEEVRKEEDRKMREMIEASKSKKDMLLATKSKNEMLQATQSNKEAIGVTQSNKEMSRVVKPKTHKEMMEAKKSNSTVGRSSRSSLPGIGNRQPGIREPVKVAAGGSGRISPDAWNKAESVRKLSLQRTQEQAKRREELLRRAEERGKVALKKAALEKRLTSLKSKLMSGEGAEAESAMGTGRQISMLGLDTKPAPTKPIHDKFFERRDSGIRDTSEDVKEAESAMGAVPGRQISVLSSGKGKVQTKSIDDLFADISNSNMRDICGEDAEVEIGPGRQISLLSLGKAPIKPIDDQFSEMSDSDISDIDGEGEEDEAQSSMKTGRQISMLDIGNGDGPTKPIEDKFSEMSDSDISDGEGEAEPALSIERQISMFGLAPTKPIDEQFSEMSDSDISDIDIGEEEDGEEAEPPIGNARQISMMSIGNGNVGITTATTKPSDYQIADKSTSVMSKVGGEGEEVASAMGTGQQKSIRGLEGTKLAPTKSIDDQFADMSNSVISDIESEVDSPFAKLSKLSFPSRLVDQAKPSEPDGPYTSTPDGAMKLKRVSSRSVAVSVSKKDLMLHTIVSGFLTRRLESIEELQVSSSSSSNLHVDSTLVTRSPTSGDSSTFPSSFVTSSPNQSSTDNKPTTESSSFVTSTSSSNQTSTDNNDNNPATQTILEVEVPSSSSSNIHVDLALVTHSSTSGDSSTFHSHFVTSSSTQISKINKSTSASSSSLNNANNTNKEVKRSTIRNFVGPEMSDSTEFFSPICPRLFRPGTVGHRQETPTSPYSIAAAEGKQEDVVASVFDQLQFDFAGLMSIERPPWSLN